MVKYAAIMANIERRDRKIFVGAEHRNLKSTASKLSREGWEVYDNVGKIKYTICDVNIAGGLLRICVLTAVKNFAQIGGRVTLDTYVGVWDSELQIASYERVLRFFEYTREVYKISGMDAGWMENVSVR